MTSGTTCHHIGFLRRGRAEFLSGSEKLVFSEGDAFFIPCGCKYRSYWYGDEIKFDSYAFTYMPEDSSDTYILQRIEMTDAAKKYLALLSQSLKVNTKSVGLLYLYLSEVLPLMQKSSADKKAVLVSEAHRYMLGHNEYTVADIARHLSVSESALYAAFRECAGHTPIEEKHSMQADKATRLLVSTDMSVEEISDRLAFSSPSYMRKILKAKTKKTPREIRKSREI